MIGPNRLPPPLPEPSPAAQRRIPAWLLSLALHLAVLLAGTLLVRGTYLPADRSESPRPTAIVLARATASEKAQYFAEEDAARDSLTTIAAKVATEALPLDSQPPAGGIALPNAPSAAADPGLLVVRPSTSGGRGKYRTSGLTAEDVAAIVAEDSARPRPLVPTGPTAKLSLFGSAEAEGGSFVFLIDCSQSMGHSGLGAIAEAAKELSASIDRLGPEQKFQVIAYNQKPVALGGRGLLSATPENKRKLIEFVETTVAYGATEHELGLLAALRYKPDVIFVFTDGGDPGLKPGQLRAIAEAAAGRTAIHCLHFGAGPLVDEVNFLERLAEQNGGSYVYIDMRAR